MRRWSIAILLACSGCGELHGAPSVDDGDDGGAEAAADAAPSTRPCDKNDHRVFVTLEPFVPGTGPDGADGQCNTDASLMGGSWVAWLSFGAIAAPTRPTPGVGYCTLAGQRVVDDTSALPRGALGHAIDVGPNMDVVPADTRVWTGTSATGSPTGNDCNGWTLTTGGGGHVGRAGATDGQWTDLGTNETCSTSAQLYCFEK